MKMIKAAVLLLLLATVIDAQPGRNRHRGHFRGHRSYFVQTVAFRPYFATPYYAGYYGAYWGAGFHMQAPMMATGDMKLADAEQIFTQIEKLGALRKDKLLTEKEFTKAKKRLLGRIGRYVRATDSAEDAAEVIGQLELLQRLKVEGLLNEAEYAAQKKKLLALI